MPKEQTVTNKVSILVAARDEADTIVRCLESLDALDFPKNQLDIWIGNDQSTDATEQLVLDYILDKPHFHYYYVKDQVDELHGKTNVLAQLTKLARGDYYFFCDADIAVHPRWIIKMLRHFQGKTGVVVGVTRMTPTGVFAAMQSIEWLISLAAMRFFSFWQIPFTGLGNNMVVSREAYKKTGGYEKIGFSIVEDFALFQAILVQGYSFVQAFEPQIVSISHPAYTISELLKQRKRWVKGAMQAPLLIRLAFYASAVFLPLVFVLLMVAPVWAFILLISHVILVGIVCFGALNILGLRDLFVYIPLFWFYFVLINPIMLLNYLLPTPTIWKGRKY